jgi:hypothetical protein
LGMTNSRLKDYFDLWVLLDRESLNIQTLAQAIAATFSRRGLALPENLPVGLTDEFSEDDSRRALWRTFLKKNNLDSLPLDAIVGKLRQTLDPVLARARTMRIE